MNIELKHGDCLEKLKDLPDNSVDSIVTDPPYGLSFMNKKWDYDVPSVEIWTECLRVLKPGGHLLSFGGSRTYHRMAVKIEDAGFEIRDQIMWIYGSGFPKSNSHLKPSHEPICMARKPFKSTVKENISKWGTGGINIEDSRIGDTVETWPSSRSYSSKNTHFKYSEEEGKTQKTGDVPNGRWPANIILDEEAGELLDQQSGIIKGKIGMTQQSSPNNIYNGFKSTGDTKVNDGITDIGGASRFFYCSKTNKKDRGEGNIHPTVKPTSLMEYLIKLVTPVNGTVLDPFMGSGSTGKAAIRNNFNFVGIEREEEYMKIAEARIKNEYGN